MFTEWTNQHGHTYRRHAWTGGDVPTATEKTYSDFRKLRRIFFREYLAECGGLALWKWSDGTGTGCMERARIFWKWANLDAWRTYSS